VSAAQVQGLLDAVAEDAAAALLERAGELLASGVGPAQVCWQLTQAVRNALIAQCAPKLLECSESERNAATRAASQFGEEELARFLQILLRASGDLRHGQQERLHFELALVRMLHARRLNSLEDVFASLGGAPAPLRSAPPAVPPAPTPSARPAATAAAPATAPARAVPPPSAPAPAPAPVTAPATGADPTAAVQSALEAAGKASVLSVVGKAQWRWSANALELIFAGANASMATVAQGVKTSLAAICRSTLGRPIEVNIVARPEEASSAPAATAAPEAPPRQGSAEARAAQHPVLQQLRQKIPSHVLKTRDLASS
jgi:DNA polymerase III gamma/tau subunit